VDAGGHPLLGKRAGGKASLALGKRLQGLARQALAHLLFGP
jgi:hypothetical protein